MTIRHQPTDGSPKIKCAKHMRINGSIHCHDYDEDVFPCVQCTPGPCPEPSTWQMSAYGTGILQTTRTKRFNGEIRDRIARVRGFKSEDPTLLGLLIPYHNFMRPHGGLGGRTPAEAAGITIAGPDKWRT